MPPNRSLSRARARFPAHDYRGDEHFERYGAHTMASLAARIRDMRASPNDRLARIFPHELGRLLRELPDSPMPPDVLEHVCDVLEGTAAHPVGRAPAYSDEEIEAGYKEYLVLKADLKARSTTDLADWLREQGLQQTKSPSDAAASAIAKWHFPAITGASLRNRFSSKRRRQLKD